MMLYYIEHYPPIDWSVSEVHRPSQHPTDTVVQDYLMAGRIDGVDRYYVYVESTSLGNALARGEILIRRYIREKMK